MHQAPSVRVRQVALVARPDGAQALQGCFWEALNGGWTFKLTDGRHNEAGPRGYPPRPEFGFGYAELSLKSSNDSPSRQEVPRPDDVADEVDAFACSKQLRSRVRLEHETSTQELPDFGFPPAQHIGFPMDQHEVVDVPNEVARAKPTLDELVERVQVDVREELAGQVPDGNAAVRAECTQALLWRDERKARGRAPTDGHLRCVMQHDLPHELPVLRVDPAPQQVEQGRLVDGSEEIADIQLKNPGADLTVASRIPQVALESSGCCVSALALPAGIRIADETGLELWFEQRMEQVMNDPVAEERRVDLARFRLVGDEDPAGLWLVAPGAKPFGQSNDFFTVPHPEGDGLWPVLLAPRARRRRAVHCANITP
jgi:hypothetical protein